MGRQTHIDSMLRMTISPLKFAALLLISAPLAGQANDLSISSAFLPPVANAESDTGDAANDDPAPQVLTMEEIDIWDRIRKGFNIQDLENPLVLEQSNWYSARPEYIQRTTTRASRYLFHVVQELEDRKSTRLNSSHIQKSRMPSSA